MKASKFTEAQKALILRQGEEGMSEVEICRKAGIGWSTCFAWKKKYGGILLDAMRRPALRHWEHSKEYPASHKGHHNGPAFWSRDL